jgi:hypothetical protein
MRKSLNFFVGNQNIAIIKLHENIPTQEWLIDEAEDIESKIDEIIAHCNYDIKIFIDTSEQELSREALISVTQQPIFDSAENYHRDEIHDSALIGSFILANHNPNQLEKTIIKVSAAKTELIKNLLNKLKHAHNSIISINSIAIELQQLCTRMKKAFVKINYDQSDPSVRSFREYDLYVMLTKTGTIRYNVFKNDIFETHICSTINKVNNELELRDIIQSDIANLLKKLDPGVNDQLNLFICLNQENLEHFREFGSKVDRLMLINTDTFADHLELELEKTNTNFIDNILAIFLEHHKPIMNISDHEFHRILKLEYYTKCLRWPTLIISCLLCTLVLYAISSERYFSHKIASYNKQIDISEKKAQELRRIEDTYLSQNNGNALFKIYQEIASYQMPFSVLEDIIKAKPQNLEYSQLLWSNTAQDSMRSSIYSNVTLISNIKTDSKNHFDTTINRFINNLTQLNPNYIVDFSVPQKQIIGHISQDKNPLIIKIRSVSEK